MAMRLQLVAERSQAARTSQRTEGIPLSLSVESPLSLKASLAQRLIWLLWGAWLAALLAAFAAYWLPPPSNNELKVLSRYGEAFYLLLDTSASMQEASVEASGAPTLQSVSKIERLKEIAAALIHQLFQKGEHSSERVPLIGVIEFARRAKILVPLTADQELLLQTVEAIQPQIEPKQRGTAIGYSVYKAAQLIAAAREQAARTLAHGAGYEIPEAAIVVITDGFQDPYIEDKTHPLFGMDPVTAAKGLLEQHIRLYFLNVSQKLEEPEFSAQRRQLVNAATDTGGSYQPISDAALAALQQELTHLEPSVLPASIARAPFDLSFVLLWLIYGALLLLLLHTTLYCTYLRHWP